MNNFSLFAKESQLHTPIEFTIKEGKSRESFVTLKNENSLSQTFDLFVQGAELNQNNQLDFITPQNVPGAANQWIKLETNQVTLAPGESREISFEINTPETANSGDHHAIIIAKPVVPENLNEPVTVINQKGVEIISHIPGEAQAQIALINEKQSECGNQECFDYTLLNQGTTKGTSKFQFKAVNDQGKTIFSETKKIELDRNQEQQLHIEWNPPTYGNYEILTELKPTDNHTSVLYPPLNHSLSFFPFFELSAIIITLLIGGILITHNFHKLQRYFKKRPHIQFGLINALIISAIITTYSILPTNLSSIIFAQEGNGKTSTDNYLTLQWGNIHQTVLPKKEKNHAWNFQIEITNGEIHLDSHLDFENSDLTTFTEQNRILQVNTTTTNAVDGMIILVRHTNAEEPSITFTNLDTNEKQQYKLSDLFNEQAFITGRQAIEVLASDSYFKAKRFYIYSQNEPLDEILNATEDVSALLEQPASPQINAGEVSRIFALLPATYEAYTEIRPTYDLISKIVAASGQVQVFADPIFINEIAASPQLLTEIATSPDRNFSFIPDRTLKFPNQPFNFSSQKILSIPIDEMLFTHQKSGKVTTYIQTSDFVSLSNENIISANNLCIIPGKIDWIKNKANNYFVQDKYCFKSNSDQTYLVERFIGEPTTFKMRPTLELKIPEGTRPATYRGTLTFTEI